MEVYDAALMVDDSGSVHAITHWIQTGGANKIVYFNRPQSGKVSGPVDLTPLYTSGYVQTTPISIGSLSGGSVLALMQYVDSSGLDETKTIYRLQGVVISGAGDVLSEYFPANDAKTLYPWLDASSVDQPKSMIFWKERTYLSASGSASDRLKIYSRSYSQDVGWGGAETVVDEFQRVPSLPVLNSYNTSYNNFKVARSADGQLHIMLVGDAFLDYFSDSFLNGSLTVPIIRTSRKAENGTWSALEDHPEARAGTYGTDGLVAKDMKVDSKGDEFILLTRKGDSLNTSNEVWVKRHVSGVGWESARRIDNPNMHQNANDPTIDVDQSGNAFVVWHEYDGAYAYAIWCARFTPAGGWESPIQISAPISFPFDDSKGAFVKVDGSGNALVVWEKYDHALNRELLRAARYTKSGGWSPNWTVSRVDGVVHDYKFSVNAKGQAAVLWTDEHSDPAGINPPEIRAWLSYFTP